MRTFPPPTNKTNTTFIPLVSQFCDTLHETMNGDTISVKKYRPHSVRTVYQYADEPIFPCDVGYGRQTKSSILANMERAKTAKQRRSNENWIHNSGKLCKIRYYYREVRPKSAKLQDTKLTPNEVSHGFLTGSKYSLSYRAMEKTLLEKNQQSKGQLRGVHKDQSGGQPYLQNNQHPKTLESRGVNTKQNFLSINRWHGAEWQVKLPKMHMPRKEKYESYGSKRIGYKNIR